MSNNYKYSRRSGVEFSCVNGEGCWVNDKQVRGLLDTPTFKSETQFKNWCKRHINELLVSVGIYDE